MLQFSDFKDIRKDELTLEEIFLMTYCLVDDSYRLLFDAQNPLRTSNNSKPIFTDSELITIALIGELKGEDSENAWWGFVKKNYLHLFPKLCERSRYNRRLRKLRGVMEQIRQIWLYQLDIDLDRYRVVDSFPLRLLKLCRLSSSSTPFEYFATVGYNDCFKEHFYGFKVHLLTTLSGIPTAFVITSAHVHDTKGFIALIQELIEQSITHIKLIVVGDKAYVGDEYEQSIKKNYGIEILPIPRHYGKEQPESALSVILKKNRRIVETTNAILTELMNANWTRCRCLSGVIARMITKITALNLANFLNKLMHQPILQVKGFVN